MNPSKWRSKGSVMRECHGRFLVCMFWDFFGCHYVFDNFVSYKEFHQKLKKNKEALICNVTIKFFFQVP